MKNQFFQLFFIFALFLTDFRKKVEKKKIVSILRDQKWFFAIFTNAFLASKISQKSRFPPLIVYSAKNRGGADFEKIKFF